MSCPYQFLRNKKVEKISHMYYEKNPIMNMKLDKSPIITNHSSFLVNTKLVVYPSRHGSVG